MRKFLLFIACLAFSSTVQAQEVSLCDKLADWSPEELRGLWKSIGKAEENFWLPIPPIGTIKTIKSAKHYKVCNSSDVVDQQLCEFNRKAKERGSNVRASGFGVEFIQGYKFSLSRGEYYFVPPGRYDGIAFLGTIQRILPTNLVHHDRVFRDGVVCDDENNCTIAGAMLVKGLEPADQTYLMQEPQRFSWPIELPAGFGVALITPEFKGIFEIMYQPRPYLPDENDSLVPFRDTFHAELFCTTSK